MLGIPYFSSLVIDAYLHIAKLRRRVVLAGRAVILHIIASLRSSFFFEPFMCHCDEPQHFYLGAGLEIRNSRYVFSGQLARGAGTRIYQVTPLEDGEERVVKVFATDLSSRLGFENEVAAQRAAGDDELKMPVEPIFGLCPEASCCGRPRIVPMLAMRRACGTLRDWVGPIAQLEFSAKSVSDLCRAIVAAVRDLHRRGVVHLDLKPGNIFQVDYPTGILLAGRRGASALPAELRGASAHNANFVLADFDLAMIGGRKVFQNPGTHCYQAPEVYLNDFCYSEQSDMWSVGCILFRIVTGQHLVPNPHDDSRSAGENKSEESETASSQSRDSVSAEASSAAASSAAASEVGSEVSGDESSDESNRHRMRVDRQWRRWKAVDQISRERRWEERIVSAGMAAFSDAAEKSKRETWLRTVAARLAPQLETLLMFDPAERCWNREI